MAWRGVAWHDREIDPRVGWSVGPAGSNGGRKVAETLLGALWFWVLVVKGFGY